MQITDCRIIRSHRRSMAIEITRQGEVLVRAPIYVSQKRIYAFVESKQGWIAEKLAKCACLPPFSAQEKKALALQAKALIPERVSHFAAILGVSVGRIAIRAQKTRWGSCSTKGNLNFNCLLALVPPEVLDYVVVHELCHLREMNHSPRFWAHVEAVLPDYKLRRKWLKEQGRQLIARLEQE